MNCNTTHYRANSSSVPGDPTYAFRPERFLGTNPGTYTWIPFGGGRRRCLGASFAQLEMKIVLRELLARCDLRPAGARHEPARRRSITISPARGATVVLGDRRPALPEPERSREGVPIAA